MSARTEHPLSDYRDIVNSTFTLLIYWSAVLKYVYIVGESSIQAQARHRGSPGSVGELSQRFPPRNQHRIYQDAS